MTEPKKPILDRLLGLFSDVRAGESGTLLLMGLNLFLALVAYYVLKTVREPLVLASGGAELKSYAAAAQAVVLMGLVPAYASLAGRVDRRRLIGGVIMFFIVCLQLFYFGAKLGVPYLGFVFFVWVGIFSLAIIAQFWSYANDLYDNGAGKRLFPVIAIGASAGAMAGSGIAAWFFKLGVGPFEMMQVAAGLLLLHGVLYLVIESRQAPSGADTDAAAEVVEEPLGTDGAFTLVFKNRYILLIGLLLIVLNVVNTTGEYILGSAVLGFFETQAALDPSLDKEAFIGAFYGQFFLYVNIAGLVLQAFAVSRIVKYLGLRGALLTLPVIAFGAYAAAAAGVGFAVFRILKSAENATDYSLMNTVKALLWLPTTREEKYKAKQAVDTFFVRFGDVLSAGVVFAGTTWFGLGMRGFAGINVVLVVVWIGLALLLLREHRRLTA
jgi:ATP:ADP antiporter, AAA family